MLRSLPGHLQHPTVAAWWLCRSPVRDHLGATSMGLLDILGCLPVLQALTPTW